MIREQSCDPYFTDALSNADTLKALKALEYNVLMRDLRNHQRPAAEEWRVYHQIALCVCYREEIMRLAQEIPTSGLLGINKTNARIMWHFQ